MSIEKLRVDKYLWCIRLFKTRSLATAACDSGKVKWKGAAIKASRTVQIGDVYDVKTDARKWTIQVTGLLAQRGSYEMAIQHYLDLTTEEDKLHNERMTTSFFTGKRMSKTGKPTKKQRRDFDDFMEE